MNWMKDRQIWMLFLILTTFPAWTGCTYDAYSDLACSTTAECPSGAVCRSGYCADDGASNNVTNNGTNNTVEIARIEVLPGMATALLTVPLQFTATAYDADDVAMTDVTFTWSVGDTSTAQIDAMGGLTGLELGSTTVQAAAQGMTGSTDVTVVTNVDRVVVTPGTTDLATGVELSFTADPQDASAVSQSRPVTWSVSNPAIISVTANGVVRGLAEGTANVIATCDGVEGVGVITVTPVVITTIELTPATVRVPHGGTQEIRAVLKDENDNEVRGVAVAWSYLPTVGGLSISPGEPDIAIYTASTTLETTVVVTAEFELLTATAELEVYRPQVASVTVQPANPTPYVGEITTMNALVIDENGATLTDRVVEWSTSDPAIVDIDSMTGEARFLSKGSADIIATVETVVGTTTATVSFELSSVATGNEHSCGLAANGIAFCWGKGGNGRLGTGVGTDAQIPTFVTSSLHFDEIRPANQHTCARAGGDIFCWGQDGNGRLGTTTGNDPNTPGNRIDGTEMYTQMDALHDHACAVTDTNDIRCWGNGGSGRLGDNSEDDNTTPDLVADPAGQTGFKWTQVAAGHSHSCAIAMNGDTYCWGKGTLGQLGDGLKTTSLIPVKVDTSGVANVAFTQVTAGDDFSCGMTAAGAAYCWGANDLGQVGTMSATTDFGTPTLVAGANVFTTVEAGYNHACGVTATNAYCWGAGDLGQRGDNTTDDATAPVVVSGSHVFTSFAAGGTHSCGVTATKTYCFGINADYQLGDDTTDQRLVPTEVWP